ncbi:MAG: OmpA family protein [Eubacteriales bacterium]|nr:OmpA family protein [Eubacteriales bacterium]MDD3571377.1 OmpA family protein [Eubacteriales bacterium]MDD4133520.1 OmpA family protein [Eubacteriales bacterium]NLO12804.1 OmpA family protein [Clostridiales bacterium]
MQRTRNRKRRLITRPDVGSYWISFSDMLSSLLLVFILAVFFSIYQYFSLLDIKTRELNEQQAELDRTQIVLAQREKDLETAQVTLMGKEEEVASIQIQLQQQEEDLFAAQAALKTKEDEQAVLQLQLISQQESLASQEIRLGAMQEALTSQQRRIDELLGVRTDIIRELSQSFSANNIAVKVNEVTGDIILDSQLMFETGSDMLSASGQAELGRLIPVYLSVLLRPEYEPYVAEVIVVGHTDSKGSYLFNLELSQNRALNVATYCLQLPGLTGQQRDLLQDIITAKGRSYSDRILNADGTENMDASRRVEIQFRLKDSEMIQKMNEILKGL